MSAILLSAVISVVVIIIFQLLIKLLRVKYAYHGLPEPLEDKHWLLGHLPIVSIFHHGFSYIGFHLFISPSFCNSFCVILPWFPSDSPNVYKRIRLNSISLTDPILNLRAAEQASLQFLTCKVWRAVYVSKDSFTSMNTWKEKLYFKYCGFDKYFWIQILWTL